MEITAPVMNSWIRQKPMMYLALRPAMASTGRDQKGCSRLVQASPQATAMATRETSTPSASAAGSMTGACTAHWPPPEGTKRLTMPALMKDQKGSEVSVAKETSASDMLAARPDCTMIAMMPA